MKYKYLLFDWDGCLAKTLDIWLDAYKEQNASYRLELSDFETVKDFFGTGDGGPAKHGLNSEEYYDELFSKIDPKLKKAELENGVEDTLRKLKNRGHVIAVVSTSSREVVLEGLKYNGITDLVEVILGYEDTENHKPDPEPLIKAIETLKGTKEKTIIVGDSDKDVTAAKRAGISSILFFPSGNRKYYSESAQIALKPDYLIREFPEILNIV